ncbi:MAG: YdjY domain-containing protein [Desulfobacteraceae bacterium]|nr:YdjY domain-containing protein [Desulfobacteraceae bacterium]
MRRRLCGIFLLLFSLCIACPAAADDVMPTKENPLVVDKEGKRILIYTEVNEKNLNETNPHWGIVSKDGKFGDKAILLSYANHLAFCDALEQIGAKPGNNLTEDTLDVPVQGDTLRVSATWPGLGREAPLEEIFYDRTGKGFEIKFGGNRPASVAKNTGCITCLESCWISITSNAKYPNISSTKRTSTPNSKFKGQKAVLPGGGKPVILIYRPV